MLFQDSAGKNMDEFDYRKYPNKLNLAVALTNDLDIRMLI